jgi:phosphoribosylanthranilate isomerase
MRDLLIKVCGMKDPENIKEVVKLNPQYLGFILFDSSPRFVNLLTAEALVKNIPGSIKKTAVLVNEPIENAKKIAQCGVFDLIQLHGNESPEYCKKLSENIWIIKAFSVSDSLPGNLSDYQPYCSMFLFDSVGEKAGGTGKKFDHSILKEYSLNTGFILSGGISPIDADYIKSIFNQKMIGVDLNSRFETEPGIKDPVLLKSFINKLRENDEND